MMIFFLQGNKLLISCQQLFPIVIRNAVYTSLTLKEMTIFTPNQMLIIALSSQRSQLIWGRIRTSKPNQTQKDYQQLSSHYF